MMRPALLAFAATSMLAQSVDDKVNVAFAGVKGRTSIGVTRTGAAIPAILGPASDDYGAGAPRVLVIAGLDGSREDAATVIEAVRAWRGRASVSAVPVANPEGWANGTGPRNAGGADVTRGYPTTGEHYSGPNPEAQYLWRWIAMHAPDLTLVAGSNDLVAALNAAGLPARAIQPRRGFLKSALQGRIAPSPARLEMRRRVARSPLEVARQLAEVYGKDLPEAVYIPAVALQARLMLGALTKDPSHLAMVEKAVEPYYSKARDSMAKATGSHLSGHLVFGDLYRLTNKPRYLELVRTAAETGWDKGAMRESMPMHNEMSDAVFMGTPLVAMAGRLTGEQRYFDMALRHQRFMLKLNLRPDGLHRHSPLDPTAWGRGNGFPALGLALTLSELPADHPMRAETLAAFQAHMAAMRKHQDRDGAWHQVIDRPESYRELTVTCMMLFAMRRGVARGWLDRAAWTPVIERAWYAVKSRVAADGSLVDVCTGTGKQTSLRAYYDRGAILGRDPRGGAMAFLAAMEMASTQ